MEFTEPDDIGAPDLTRDSEGPELSIDYLPHVETKNSRAPDLPFGSAKGEPELEPGCIKKPQDLEINFYMQQEICLEGPHLRGL